MKIPHVYTAIAFFFYLLVETIFKSIVSINISKKKHFFKKKQEIEYAELFVILSKKIKNDKIKKKHAILRPATKK
jgi:hypothetical protein